MLVIVKSIRFRVLVHNIESRMRFEKGILNFFVRELTDNIESLKKTDIMALMNSRTKFLTVAD